MVLVAILRCWWQHVGDFLVPDGKIENWSSKVGVKVDGSNWETVHFRLLDRPLSRLVHFQGSSTFLAFLTVHFPSFRQFSFPDGPSNFTQDRPLSPRPPVINTDAAQKWPFRYQIGHFGFDLEY